MAHTLFFWRIYSFSISKEDKIKSINNANYDWENVDFISE